MTASAERVEQAGLATTVELNHATFVRLLARAAAELDRDRLERAAAAARVAATYAWFNHPGLFASRDLEGLLAEIGRRLQERPTPTAVVPGRVLHVATELYGTGGHTQMLAGWVGADGDSEHLVCLTGQRGRPIPQKILGSLGPDGADRVLQLDATADRLLDRAIALREVAASAEVIVLHPHPDDVVPGLAFAPGHRPPGAVFLVNHADHVFWVGGSAADVVLNMRRSGAELTTSRRGVAPSRQDTLIRPLRLEGRTERRAEARAALGVPDGVYVVATAADGSKYEAACGPGFLDVVRPLLERRPDVLLLAAGPAPEGPWAVLDRAGQGRALGLLPGIAPLLEAADLYLDSYPFSSLTSMLEAAALGIPVLTLREPSEEPAVLGADTPELDGTLVVASSPEELRGRIEALLDDHLARTRLGQATRAGVDAAHGHGAWVARVHEVLAAAAEGDGPDLPADDVRRAGPLDLRVAELQAQTGWGRGEHGAALLNAGFLPLGRRLGLAAREVRTGRGPALRSLLSHRGARRLRRIASRG